MSDIIPKELIENKILFIRSKKVMLDRDLAELYGVTTKRLNEQVKRNLNRFPSDFMFRLSKKEMQELVANCDRFSSLKHSTSLSYVFTEYGAIMLASVLNSNTAIMASIQIVKVFVQLRDLLSKHKDLKKKIEEMETKYDYQFKVVFDAIRQLLDPPNPPQNKKYGFLANRD